MIYHRYPFLYYLVHWSQYLFSISCLLTNYVGVKHALYKFFYALRCYNQLLNGSIFCFTTNHVALHSIDSSPLVFHIGRLWGLFVSFFQMKRFCSFWWTVPPFIRFPLLCNFGFPLLCHNYSLYFIICQYTFIYFII